MIMNKYIRFFVLPLLLVFYLCASAQSKASYEFYLLGDLDKDGKLITTLDTQGWIDLNEVRSGKYYVGIYFQYFGNLIHFYSPSIQRERFVGNDSFYYAYKFINQLNNDNTYMVLTENFRSSNHTDIPDYFALLIFDKNREDIVKSYSFQNLKKRTETTKGKKKK